MYTGSNTHPPWKVTARKMF